MTTVTTNNPVRSDVLETPHAAPRARSSRAWAFAGVGAAIAGMGTIVTSSMVDVVYREEFNGTTQGVADALADKAGVMFAFHSITVAGAVLMLVFASGLHRRLRAAMPDSIVPTVAFGGLLGTAVVSVLGAGLDTEYMMAFAAQDGVVDDSTAAMYNHWIGTIPWVWTLAGVAGLALFSAFRQRAVARWVGLVGLVLGGLTVVFGISPLEYISGATGALMLLVVSIGFAAGDRKFRATAS